MELTFLNDFGQSFVIEIDPHMELENVMALLEVESGLPVEEQWITCEGRVLDNPKATMRECGVAENAILLLRRKVNIGGRATAQDAEMMRLQLLGDPNLMQQVAETEPELISAAQADPERFEQLLRQPGRRRPEPQRELSVDPFDYETQRQIEEQIRQQAVRENMEHALEYSPESFARVTMLYIPVEVNSKPVRAFVDSGAQSTIMSPGCAEACGIMRLVDRRFAGLARGVGTARILGRVHSAQIKVADLFLPCAFTIMEGKDVDLLFGLDMLKAHQACIDLEKNVLRIQGREVPFLPEHELPETARFEQVEDGDEDESAKPGPSSFPGSGNTLSTAPSSHQQPKPSSASSSRPSRTSNYSEEVIVTLMGLGASRELAIQTLDAANGNLDIAASMLF